MTCQRADGHRWLVATDVDAIQSYVLASLHLSTIAGASQIIVEADALARQLARKLGGETIVGSGGIGLVCFLDQDAARSYARRVRREFRLASVSGTLTVSDPVDLDRYQHRIGDGVQEAFTQVEQRKRRGQVLGEIPASALGELCESCGAEAAYRLGVVGREGEEDVRLFGPSCWRKYERRNRRFWLHGIEGKPRALAQVRLARDFNELAGENDLGLIVADADGTGRLLNRLVSEPLEHWREFSENLDLLSHRTLVEAILAVTVGEIDQPRGRCFPVGPLFCGGDDFVIACRGALALPLAARLTTWFSEGVRGQSWCPGERLGLSAAVVVTRSGFPFRSAHRVATYLLSRAKAAARTEGWSNDGIGAIEYALITESSADPEVLLKERSFEQAGSALELTGRPYKAARAGARSIGAIESVRNLLVQDFPRSRLHELRRLCSSHEVCDMAGSVARTHDDIHRAALRLDEKFATWLRRTGRDPGLSDCWKAVCNQIHGMASDDLDSSMMWQEGLSPRQKESNAGRELLYRTAVGDLADLLRLWGDQ